MAILATFNNQDADSVILKARGRSITTAVDVAEITRNRYITDLMKPVIVIETERITDGDQTRNVSSMSITLTRGEEKETEEVVEAETVPGSVGVSEIDGVGKITEEKLKKAGYDTVEKIIRSEPEELALKTGLSETQITKIIEAAKEI